MTDPSTPTRGSAARDHTSAGADIQKVVTIAGGDRVEHRLDELPEERAHKELLVYLRGRHRDLNRGGVG